MRDEDTTRMLKVFKKPLLYSKIVLDVVTRMERPFRVLWNYFTLSQPEYTYTFRNKLRISTKKQGDVQILFSIFFHNIYGNVGSGKTIIDLGSNIGVFTLFSAYEKNNIIYAFEPSPINFELLETNVKNNTNTGKVTVVAKAIGSKRGTFLMSSNLGIYSRLYIEGEKPKPGEVIDEVECITLEDIFNEYAIETCDLLKIDCEGFEYDILFCAPDYLFKRILEIRMECDLVDSRRNIKTMQNFLVAKGYRITHVDRCVLFAKRD